MGNYSIQALTRGPIKEQASLIPPSMARGGTVKEDPQRRYDQYQHKEYEKTSHILLFPQGYLLEDHTQPQAYKSIRGLSDTLIYASLFRVWITSLQGLR